MNCVRCGSRQSSSDLPSNAAAELYLLLNLDFICLPVFRHALYTHILPRFIVDLIHAFFR